MSWYDNTYTHRTAITVVNTAGDATIDVDVVIPPEWDDFWGQLSGLSDDGGDSIRICGSDGVTLLDYSVDDGAGGTFSASDKTGRIRIDGVAVSATANSIVCLWLYWFPQSAQASAAVATTIASSKTGYLDLGSPTSRSYTVQSAAVGATTPSKRFQKGSGDTDDIWLDLSGWLEKSAVNQGNNRKYEEPKHVVITAIDESSSPITTVYTVGATRWAEQPDGKMYLRVQVTAGSSGTNYTIKPTITTVIPDDSSDHRVLDERFGLHVVDVEEAA